MNGSKKIQEVDYNALPLIDDSGELNYNILPVIEEEEKKTLKDYSQETLDFLKKIPGFAGDWAERLASSALKIPKQAGQGLEQFQRNKDWIFQGIQKEYEALGLSEESAEKLSSTLKKILPIPGNKINTGFEVAEGVYQRVKDTPEFQSLEEISEKLYEKSDRYKGRGIIELWKEGDRDAAIGALILYGAESMPQSILAAAGGPAGAAGLGLMAAGAQYDELAKRDDMSEAVKMINSNLNGMLEAFTEYIGSVQIGRIMKNVLAKSGKKGLREFAEKASRNWLSNVFKKAGMWTAPMIEGVEEFANALGSNIVAKYTGEDPERELWQGVAEQTFRGIGGGGHFTGAGLSMQGIQKVIQRVQESQIEKETPTPTDREKTPQTTGEQPKIPIYKIGDTEYENRNTFLSEVEKLEGQENIPEVVVDNDAATMTAVKEILGPQIKEDSGISYIEPRQQTETIRGFTHYKSGGKFINRTTWADWFSGRDRKAKEKIAKEIEDNPELKNALLSSWYDEYIKDTGEEISFDEFLDKEIEVYRGETEGDVKTGEPFGFQSFAPTEEEAKNFSRTGRIIKEKIRPRKTFGLTQIQGAEREILVPTKYSVEFSEKQWNNFADNNMQIIEKLSDAESIQLSELVDDGKFAEAIEFLKQKDDSKTQRRIPRSEPLREEPGRTIQEPEEGTGETEAGGIFQKEEQVEQPEQVKEEVKPEPEKQVVKEKPKKKPVQRISAEEARKLREMSKETRQIKEDAISQLTKAVNIWEQSGGKQVTWGEQYQQVINNLKKAGYEIREEEYNGRKADNVIIKYGDGKEMSVNVGSLDIVLERIKKKWPVTVQKPKTSYTTPSKRKIQHQIVGVKVYDRDGNLKSREQVMEELDWRIETMQENLDQAETPEAKEVFQAELDYLNASRRHAGDYYTRLIEEQENIESDETEPRDFKTIAGEAETIGKEADAATTEAEITASEERIDNLVTEIDQKIQEQHEIKNLLQQRRKLEEEGKDLTQVDKRLEELYYQPGEMVTYEEKVQQRKEPEAKEEQVKKGKESLLAAFSGIKGFFEVPKKRGKQEKQRDELTEWLNQQKQQELDAAETDEQKIAIEKDYKKKLRDTQKLFSRDKYDAQTRALEVRRKILKDFIADNRGMLKRVHGNVVPAMLNRVNDAKTIKGLNRAMDYMEQVMNKQKDREEAILWSNKFDQIQKQLDPLTYKEKGAETLKGKINVTSNLLSTLDRLRDNLFNKSREEGQRLATELVNKIMEENRDITAEEFEMLEEYKTYGIAEMSPEEITWANDYIKTRIKGKKTKAFTERFAKQQEENQRIEHFATTIRGGKPKQETIYDNREKLKPKSKRSILDFIFNSNFFSILNKISQHEYRTNPEVNTIYGSELERYWMHRIHEADNNFHDGIRKITEKAHDKYKEIFGGERKGSKLKRYLLRRADQLKHDLVEIKYKGLLGGEKTARFTQEELGYIYSILRNEDMHESLSKIDPKESMGGMIRFNNETGEFEKTDLANQIEKALDPEMKQWAEYIGDVYDNELYDRYNESYKKFFAFDMPRSRMYVPIFRSTKENADQGIEEMLQKETFSSMGYNRHLYQRKPNSNPIKIMSASDVFFSYVNKMERFHNRADVLQEMKRFFKNPDIIKAIEESGGTKYNKAIDQFLDRYAGVDVGRTVKEIDYIRRQVTRASLALKPVIFVKQLMSFPAYSSFLPAGQLIKGMAKFWKDPIKNWKMLSESSYILNRYNAGFDRDIADAMIKDYQSKKPIIDSWLNHAMFMVKWGDRMPIILAGYSVYDYNYNKFLNEGQTKEQAHKNAIREFELTTRLTQQASDIADLGFWQSQSSFSKLFTMYTTAPLSYQRMASGGVRMAISGAKGRDWKTFRKGAKTAFVAHVLLPTLFQLASNGFELDDEEERKDLLWAAILGNINNYFLIGDAIDAIMDTVRDRPFDYQGTPVESIVTDAKRAITETVKLYENISKGKDLTFSEYLDAIERITRTPSFMMGLPLPGAARVTEGIARAIEDDDATAAKKIKWILGYSEKGLDRADVQEKPKYQ